MIDEVIGARNVGAFIDRLRQAPQPVQALRLRLLDDIPIQALGELLAALEGLPHLASLDIEVSLPTSGQLSTVKRRLFAQSPVCLRLSLQVRRYLVRGADWKPAENRWWRGFFECVDWLEVPDGDSVERQNQPFDVQIRWMAWSAFTHKQYFLLRALRTLYPHVCVSFESRLPSQAEVHWLSRIDVAMRVYARVYRTEQLVAICRLLRNPRARVTELELLLCVALSAREAGSLLRSISKAPCLTDLCLGAGWATFIDWPTDGVPSLPSNARLTRLRLNLQAFIDRLPVAAQCLRAWSPRALHLLMPCSRQWTVLGDDNCLQALRQTQRLVLHIHDEALPTKEMSRTLQGHLNRLLEQGHQLQALSISLDSNGSLSCGKWDDWVFKQRHPLPLKTLSVELRLQWMLSSKHTLQWRLEDVWREAFASSGAKAFFTQELKLVDDVWNNMAGKGWLSLRDASHLAQVSKTAYEAADEKRRGTQAAALAELMTLGALSDEELRATRGCARRRVRICS